ncbi:MAG: ATP-binding domain-containing protein [Candidatus Scalindua sp.]|nr:ATP-binding domain-containing protein [Candidatus Scalindua sp.]
MLIPDNIDKFESHGERLLYIKFKNDKSATKFYVLHSVFTNYHFKNITGELDFLVLAPGHGIFAIEVKHGGVRRKGGTWFYENRHGKVTATKKSPFDQVSGTMNSIRAFLLSKLADKKENYRFSKILFGTGVAFTSMNEFVDFGQEAHSWQILTRQSMKLPVYNYIDTLSKGLHNQHKRKSWYDVNLSIPTDKDCKKIIQILRGDFDIDYSEINKIIDSDYLIEEHTKEQFHLLDILNYNDRCLIQGPAGTGKTIMAIEAARRKILAGKKVALLCFNRGLGLKLKKSLEYLFENKMERSFSGTFHTFMSDNTKLASPVSGDDKTDFYKETLPFEFLLQNEYIPEEEKYDLLILDESQDLITPFYIEVFNSMLKGGLKDGSWVLFGDFSNQAIYLNNPIESINLLNEISTFTNFPPLKINCRNTKKIASHNTLLTGVDKPDFTGKSIDGDSIVDVFPSKNKQVECVEDVMKELLKEGVPIEKVTLLSPKRIENTFIKDSLFVNELISNGLTFSTIHSFKGLENTIIIILGFEEITSEESKRLLYVGISRARQKLYLILNEELKHDYQKIIDKNIIKLSE